MLSPIVVNPLPLIVISRNFNGNFPVISLRKSVAAIFLWVIFGPEITFCGSGELIQSFCKFDKFDITIGILKSGRSEYVDNCNERNDVDLPNAPFCKN